VLLQHEWTSTARTHVRTLSVFAGTLASKRRWLLASVVVIAGCLRAPAQRHPEAITHAPAPGPVYSESDSAAVFSAAVDHMLTRDGGRAPTRSVETGPARELTVFTRIGPMPQGAWAALSVARLRTWRWSYGGMAVDSTSILNERSDSATPGRLRTFPVELVLGIRFEHDSAYVQESWIWNTCEIRPNSMRVVQFTQHAFVRTGTGWRHVDRSEGGGMSDGLCPHHWRRE